MTPQRPDDIRRISLKTLVIENSVKSKNTYFLNVFQAKDAIGSEYSNISVKRLLSDTCMGIEISSASGTETFLFSNENKISYGDIISTAKWISVVKDNTGKVLKQTSFG